MPPLSLYLRSSTDEFVCHPLVGDCTRLGEGRRSICHALGVLLEGRGFLHKHLLPVRHI